MGETWSSKLSSLAQTRARTWLTRTKLALLYPRPRPFRTVYGFQLVVDPRPRWIDQNLVTRGAYEPGTLSLLRKLLTHDSTFIDAGANIGLMSMYAALPPVSCRQVFAFEPDHINYGRLVRAKELNEAHVVCPFPIALGASPGRARLNRDASGDGGLSSLREAHGLKSQEEVPVTSLDALLPAFDHGRIDLIKVDVEGSEHEVCAGALQTARTHLPTFLIEMVEESGLKAAQLLSDIGYAMYTSEGKGAVEISHFRRSEIRLLEHDNAVLIHQSKVEQIKGRGFVVIN
jgi:FkbM family methyltransferase